MNMKTQSLIVLILLTLAVNLHAQSCTTIVLNPITGKLDCTGSSSGSSSVAVSSGAGTPTATSTACTSSSTSVLGVYVDTSAGYQWWCSNGGAWQQIQSSTQVGGFYLTGNAGTFSTGVASSRPSCSTVSYYLATDTNALTMCNGTSWSGALNPSGAQACIMNSTADAFQCYDSGGNLTSGSLTGPAGGALSGSYPNPCSATLTCGTVVPTANCTPGTTPDYLNTATATRYYCSATNTWAVGQSVVGNLSIGSTVLGDGQFINAKGYGAKGDGRTVLDAVTTAASTALTSATAAFTAADTGKTITVEMGAQGIAALTYTSGGSITGATGTTCILTITNGGGTGATGLVWLTGTNAIAGATAIRITAPGTGFTGNATTATLSNGTATCSGTATVATTAFVTYPVTTTLTYVNATTVTLGVAATTSRTGAVSTWATDDSAAVIAAIAAAGTAGGIPLYFPAGQYLILSQLAIPNNSGSPVPAMRPITLIGAGASQGAFNSQPIGAAAFQPYGGTVLDLRYSGAGGKIDAASEGKLEIANMVLADYGWDTTYFVRSTNNATLYLHDNLFLDSWAKSGLIGNTDRTAVYVDGAIGGSVIRNTFSKIRTGVFIATSSNGLTVRDNYYTTGSGGDADPLHAAIVLAQLGSIYPLQGIDVSHNNFEMGNYVNGISCVDCTYSNFLDNEFEDVGAYTAEYLTFGAAASFNRTNIGVGFVSDANGGNSVLYPCATYGTCMASLNVTALTGGGATLRSTSFEQYGAEGANSAAAGGYGLKNDTNNTGFLRLFGSAYASTAFRNGLAISNVDGGDVFIGGGSFFASMWITNPNIFPNHRYVCIGACTAAPTSPLQVLAVPVYANNAAALAGGLTVGATYRTGADPDPVMIVH